MQRKIDGGQVINKNTLNWIEEERDGNSKDATYTTQTLSDETLGQWNGITLLSPLFLSLSSSVPNFARILSCHSFYCPLVMSLSLSLSNGLQFLHFSYSSCEIISMWFIIEMESFNTISIPSMGTPFLSSDFYFQVLVASFHRLTFWNKFASLGDAFQWRNYLLVFEEET